jgi:hypothetical protein
LGEVMIPNFCGKSNANSSFKYDLSNLSRWFMQSNLSI